MLAGLVLLLGLQVMEAAPRADTPAPAAAGPEYRLGPDDGLRITVFGHPDLTQELVVAPDGSIDFPLIGKVEAAEKLPTEVEAAIALRLARGYVSEPQVRVLVTSYRSKVVFVMGELSRPGAYPLSQGRTAVEILARAGPLLPSAGTELLVLRPRAGGTGAAPAPAAASDVLHVDLEALRSDLQAHNLVLEPGDTVFVPKASRVFVSGEVKAPGAYAVQGDTTIRQAIALAGGFAKRAARDKVRVLRQVDGRASELRAGLEEVVHPGDTLVVEKKRGLF
jgi:polysaccharide biosynthesis/export protein